MSDLILMQDNTHQLQALEAQLTTHLPQTWERLLELLGTTEGRRILPASPLTGSRITIPVRPEGAESSPESEDTLLMLGGLPHPLDGLQAPSQVLGRMLVLDDDIAAYEWPDAAPLAHRGWRLMVQRMPDLEIFQLSVCSLPPATGQLLQTVVADLDDAGVAYLVEAALMAEALLLPPADMMQVLQDAVRSLDDDLLLETVAAD